MVFRDHERRPADMTAFPNEEADTDDPVRHACDATRLALRMYAENPTFSVHCYRLTKQVPGLRVYELPVVRRYERAHAEYLRGRSARGHADTLRADVVAAAVVAAHNNALRSCLRSDGTGDAEVAVDRALGYVQNTFGSSPGEPAHKEPEDVVVVVSRAERPCGAWSRRSGRPSGGTERKPSRPHPVPFLRYTVPLRVALSAIACDRARRSAHIGFRLSAGR